MLPFICVCMPTQTAPTHETEAKKKKYLTIFSCDVCRSPSLFVVRAPQLFLVRMGPPP